MIELRQPGDGVCVCLQTPFQKEFIKDGRKYLCGELDLQNFRDQSSEDTSRPCKIVFRWEATDGLASVIEISENEDFSKIFLSGKGKNLFEAYNFEIGRKYFWRVRNAKEESGVFSFSTEDAAPRFLYFDGTTNVRDLGGYITEDGNRIKQGLLYRGAELDMHDGLLTLDGKYTMHDVLGIRTDLDLRGEAIGFANESPVGEDVKYVQVALRAYEDYIKEGNFENVARIFDLLSDRENYPLYFHCWGGADRTGCLAFTIEAILGLAEERLMQDFELTCLSKFGNVKNRNDEDFAAMVNTLYTYGNTWRERMTEFLIKCGVSMKKIDRVREILLEKP